MRRGGKQLVATENDRREVARFRYFLRIVSSASSPAAPLRTFDRSGLRPLQLLWLERYSAGRTVNRGLRPRI